MITFLVASLISGYQVYRCLIYLKKSVRLSHGYAQKVEQGCVRWWEYMFMFIPIRYRDYIDEPGLQGGNFYLTPLVFFFALFGNPLGWALVLFMMVLSLGGGLFKLCHKAMLKLPFYWAYFASLGVVWLSVDGIKKFALGNQQLILINILLGCLLLFNRGWLPVYPYNYWAKKPSAWFDTPLLRFLEKNSQGYRVNNLPYPVYHGQINHIKSMGYMGGNHLKEQGEFRGVDKVGSGGYNWFDYLPDSDKLDKYGVKYHIGNRPSDDPKWVKVDGFNLWENKKVSREFLFKEA